MPLQNTDLFIVERGGVQYKMTAEQIADFVGAVRDLTAGSYADMLAGTFTGGETAKVGDKVFLADASGDPTVDAGYAGYRVDSISPIAVTKLYEQESMDFTIVSTDLNYVPSASGGSVTNSNGTGFTIPDVSSTNAGLATPALLAASHAAVTVGLTVTTNPINVSGQELTFGIDQLLDLP